MQMLLLLLPNEFIKGCDVELVELFEQIHLMPHLVCIRSCPKPTATQSHPKRPAPRFSRGNRPPVDSPPNGVGCETRKRMVDAITERSTYKTRVEKRVFS